MAEVATGAAGCGTGTVCAFVVNAVSVLTVTAPSAHFLSCIRAKFSVPPFLTCLIHFLGLPPKNSGCEKFAPVTSYSIQCPYTAPGELRATTFRVTNRHRMREHYD